VAQALRPFPQFANIPVQGDPIGKTWYNALQVKMTKRISHGLSVTSTFSWQKSEDVGVDGNTGSTVPNGGGAATNYVNNVVLAPYSSKAVSALDQWNPRKAAANFTRHRVRFAEAVPVLEDDLAITIIDFESDETEERFVTVGVGAKGRLLVVGLRGPRRSLQIISARQADQHERENYAQGAQ
jgi:uncharacterized protein